MNQKSRIKKENKKNTIPLGMERDAPYDFESESNDTQFAQFYLEQHNQNSNVYFAQYQREKNIPIEQPARVKKKGRSTSPFFVLRQILRVGMFGSIAVMLFLGAMWWWNGSAKMPPAVADARDVYTDILSAQKEFSGLHFEKAMFLFQSAYERIAKREQNNHSLIGYAQSALSSFIYPNGTDSTETSALEEKIFNAGEKIAHGMEPLLALSLSSFFNFQSNKEQELAGEAMGDALLGVEDARATLEKVRSQISDVEKNTTQENSEITTLAPQLSLVFANAQKLVAQLRLAVWALGMERPRKFLLIAQDSASARATGGVIRSVGALTTRAGAITDVTFDDVLGVDGQLQVNVVPPVPIQQSATAWALHDANWFLDFPLSAKKIAYFYEKSGGGEVDGVIAFNDHMVKKILTLTGPVKGEDGVLVNGENQPDLVKKEIVSAIASVIPTLSNSRALIQAFQDGFYEKDIMIWLSDRDYQKKIANEGWSGEMINEEGVDYLAVVSSDTGNSTENAREEILKETHFMENGDIINTVAIQFSNVYDNNTPINRERYVRIYTPKGSQLLELSGITGKKIVPQIDYIKERFIIDEDVRDIETTAQSDASSTVSIFEESDKTVFGGWTTKEEKNAIVIAKYRLPFLFAKNTPITFIFQKQPGVNAKINTSLIVPEGMRASDKEGNDMSAFSAPWDTTITRTVILQ